MKNNIHTLIVFFFFGMLWLASCKIPKLNSRTETRTLPSQFSYSKDTNNNVVVTWREYFKDTFLIALIDTALKNNQELNIALQEIEMSKNEIMVRKGEYHPFVQLNSGFGADKSGRYTWDGISEDDLKANPDKAPKHIGDFVLGVNFSWELDIWKKLRNGKRAAVLRYLASIEGRNFMVTNLIAEIAASYYELVALDNLIFVVNQNIEIQKNALSVVKLEKEAAKVTQLAVNRFEAQLLHTSNMQFGLKQQMVETENRIQFLTGQLSHSIKRTSIDLNTLFLANLNSGIPSQLLNNRPDIREAEKTLSAAKLDVKIARANFFPSARLVSGIGLNAFNPAFLFNPESFIYNLAGDVVGPLINRNAIKANYLNANANQLKAVFHYEQTILQAYLEVVNQLSQIDNYTKSIETKAKEVEILTESVDISNGLFRSARADYLEVLLTQQEVLDSKIELIETKLKELVARVNIYKALGGGWK